MKIHADKIEGEPSHAFTVRDVKIILKMIPPEWIEGIKEVHLSNSLEYYRPYAFINRFDGCLTIYSRNGTRARAVTTVLSTLAAASMGLVMRLGLRQEMENARRTAPVIKPYVEQIVYELTPRKGYIGNPCSPQFRPVTFKIEGE